jgi:hypothetical protein
VKNLFDSFLNDDDELAQIALASSVEIELSVAMTDL